MKVHVSTDLGIYENVDVGAEMPRPGTMFRMLVPSPGAGAEGAWVAANFVALEYSTTFNGMGWEEDAYLDAVSQQGIDALLDDEGGNPQLKRFHLMEPYLEKRLLLREIDHDAWQASGKAWVEASDRRHKFHLVPSAPGEGEEKDHE
jgi:hypothetical protein